MLRKSNSNNAQVPKVKAAPNKKKIAGVVKDASGDPVIGASVSVKGSSARTITDVNGRLYIILYSPMKVH